MQGDEFYAKFKEALDYLGVGFRGMGQVQVDCTDAVFRIFTDTDECQIKLTRPDPKLYDGEV